MVGDPPSSNLPHKAKSEPATNSKSATTASGAIPMTGDQLNATSESTYENPDVPDVLGGDDVDSTSESSLDSSMDASDDVQTPRRGDDIVAIQEGHLPDHLRPAQASDDEVGLVQEKSDNRKGAKKAARRKIGKLVQIKKPQTRLPSSVEHSTESAGMQWYVVRTASGRENTVKKALDREVKKSGLSELIASVSVPVESAYEVGRDGQKRKVTRKLYPGYVIVQMALNEITQQLIRKISGVGDFVSPHPMSDREVEKMLLTIAPKDARAATEIKIDLVAGQKVKIKEGPFENFEGEVKEVNTSKGTITVVVEIFFRKIDVNLEHWQAEAL